MAERPARINRWIWTSCGDDETCATCRQLDGKEWGREKDVLWPPATDCRNPEGCRCQIVGVYDDEGKVISQT